MVSTQMTENCYRTIFQKQIISGILKGRVCQRAERKSFESVKAPGGEVWRLYDGK